MECLEALLEKEEQDWDLNLDLGQVSSLEEAKKLWNLCVRLSVKASSKHPQLANFRKLACLAFEQQGLGEKLNSCWLRTAKAFIDTQNYFEAEECFRKVTFEAKSKEFQLNYFFWKLQLEFYSGQNYTQYLDKLPLGESRIEDFRVTRFLYCEVCKVLYESQNYQDLEKVLEVVIEHSKGSIPASLETVHNSAKTLKCEVLLETSRKEQAQSLLSQLPQTPETLFVELKLCLEAQEHSGIQDLFESMLQVCNQEELLRSVHLLVSRNKLIDSCKALLSISKKHSGEEVYLLWFKLLLTLYINNEIYEKSFEYLNIEEVLLCLSKTQLTQKEEVLSLTWELCNEMYQRGLKEEVPKLIEEVYLPLATAQQETQGILLMAKCFLDSEDSLSALQFLQSLPESHEKQLLELKANLQVGKVDTSTLKSFIDNCSPESALDLIKDLVSSSFPTFSLFIFEVSDSVVSILKKVQNPDYLLVPLCEKCPDCNLLVKFLRAAVDLDLTEREWYFALSYNKALEVQDSCKSFQLFEIALSFAYKGHFYGNKNSLYCLVGLIRKGLECNLELGNYIEKLKDFADHQEWKNEILALEFEYRVKKQGDLTSFLQNCSPENCYFLAQVSTHNKAAIQCLTSYLQKAALNNQEKLQTLKQMCRLAQSFEEWEALLNQSLEVSGVQNLEWFLATCWNNALKAFELSDLNSSEKWLLYALKFAEKSNDSLLGKVQFVYNEVALHNSSQVQKIISS